MKFYRPGCDRCRALEPAWSAIEAEQLGSDALVVAQVDCIGSGLELCARFGVKGFPSVLSFSPPDYEQGEVYDGSRDVESLLNFAAGLGPACSLTHPGECSADELLRLEEYANMRPEEREQKVCYQTKTAPRPRVCLARRERGHRQSPYTRSTSTIQLGDRIHTQHINYTPGCACVPSRGAARRDANPPSGGGAEARGATRGAQGRAQGERGACGGGEAVGSAEAPAGEGRRRVSCPWPFIQAEGGGQG